MKNKIYLLFGLLILLATSCKKQEEKVLGKNWTLEADQVFKHIKSDFGVTAFQNKLWVVGGIGDDTYYSDDVYFSQDGIKWKKIVKPASFSGRKGLTLITFKGKLWIMGGQKSEDGSTDIWSSRDGIHWEAEVEEAPFGRRYGETIFTFKDKLWLIGGVKSGSTTPVSDIWSSVDGVNWVQESETSTLPSKLHAEVQEKDGKLWLVGGVNYDNMTPYLDVWSSEDGINWVEINTQGLQSSPRTGHRLISHDDKLWLIAGVKEYPKPKRLLNDVWATKDGTNWELVKQYADFSPRKNHGAASFKGKMFVFGGSWWLLSSSDVWSSE